MVLCMICEFRAACTLQQSPVIQTAAPGQNAAAPLGRMKEKLIGQFVGNCHCFLVTDHISLQPTCEVVARSPHNALHSPSLIK